MSTQLETILVPFTRTVLTSAAIFHYREIAPAGTTFFEISYELEDFDLDIPPTFATAHVFAPSAKRARQLLERHLANLGHEAFIIDSVLPVFSN